MVMVDNMLHVMIFLAEVTLYKTNKAAVRVLVMDFSTFPVQPNELN